MSSPERAQVVIACPSCGTRYQLAYAAIGAKGRTVACASCGQSWQAQANVPAAGEDFSALAEAALDEKMIVEERRQQARRAASLEAQTAARAARSKSRSEAQLAAETRAAAKAGGEAPTLEETAAEAAHRRTLEQIRAAVMPAPPPAAVVAKPALADPAVRRREQAAFSSRQRRRSSRLPLARLRRNVRIGVAVALIGVIGGGVLGRGAIVEQFPSLAGIYSALGLGVNVVGLDFAEVRTLRSLSEGNEVLVVSGRIRSVAHHTVLVPQMIVTLIGANGESLYEWSVEPQVDELEPGEAISFETRLTAPPAAARDVRLTFANARSPSPAASGSIPRGGK